MPVFQTYASRVAAKAGEPDAYTYDNLPPFLREQVSQILTACIGLGLKVSPHEYVDTPPNANWYWESIAEIMRREIKSFIETSLPSDPNYAYGQCINYIKFGGDLNGILSLIEICGGVMMTLSSQCDPQGY